MEEDIYINRKTGTNMEGGNHTLFSVTTCWEGLEKTEISVRETKL
jgi:hypothetical protein